MGADRAFSALIVLVVALAIWSLLAGVHRRRRFVRELERRSGHVSGAVLPEQRRKVGVRARAKGRMPSPETVSRWSLEVAARLRAGAPPALAWEQTWTASGTGVFLGVDEDGAPLNLLELTKLRRGLMRRREADLSRSAIMAIVQACRFSHGVGAPLAGVLEVMARATGQATHAITAQKQAFTGPRLSSYVLAGLPLIAVFGGQILGAGTLSWLLREPIGNLALLLGLSFLFAAFAVSDRLIHRAQGRIEEEIEATQLADLARSGLASGASIPAVLTGLGAAREDSELSRIASELIMNATWDEAWHGSSDTAALLRTGLRPAWEDGVSPLLLLEHAALSRREAMVAQSEQAAAQLAVQLVIPLGLFLLPAFVLLGVLPVLFTLLGGALLN